MAKTQVQDQTGVNLEIILHEKAETPLSQQIRRKAPGYLRGARDVGDEIRIIVITDFRQFFVLSGLIMSLVEATEFDRVPPFSQRSHLLKVITGAPAEGHFASKSEGWIGYDQSRHSKVEHGVNATEVAVAVTKARLGAEPGTCVRETGCQGLARSIEGA